jgi:quinol monooxygenase YgiN
MTHYYVYYKISPDQIPRFREAVQTLFKTIEKQCGVRGRWMRRRDDPSTCMEVYEEVKDAAAFEALLEREGAKLGVQRKLERFVNAG